MGRKLTIEQGIQAAQAEDFVIALKRLREALPDSSASVHLGFLLHRLGRDTDAEPLLLEVANTGDTGPWLALGDLYWKAGLRPLAKAAYRQYLAELPRASSRREGDLAGPYRRRRDVDRDHHRRRGRAVAQAAGERSKERRAAISPLARGAQDDFRS